MNDILSVILYLKIPKPLSSLREIHAVGAEQTLGQSMFKAFAAKLLDRKGGYVSRKD